MPIEVLKSSIESDLAREVARLSQTKVNNCYQCGKCSAGCPVATEMDYLPSQILRLAQLGEYEKALRSRTIWICASCITCSTRCPREVEIAAVMDAMREISLNKGIADPKSREIVQFHRAFLDTVRMYGRMAEFTLVGEYKMRSGKFFADMFAAPKMWLRGKLHFLPHFLKGRKEVRKIFKNCGY